MSRAIVTVGVGLLAIVALGAWLAAAGMPLWIALSTPVVILTAWFTRTGSRIRRRK